MFGNLFLSEKKYYYICLILCIYFTEYSFKTTMDYKFINTEYLESVSGGDNEIIREIVVMFGEQVVETANQMKTLLAERNYTTLGLLAHKAKSSVAIMGMSDLAALLKTFELQAKEGIETELYESYINRFVFETGEAMKELNELVNNRLKKI